MKFRRVMIMGAGAVGGYFGGRLAAEGATGVTMVARGDHLEALRDEGLRIENGETSEHVSVEAVRSPDEAKEQPDLVLLTVKSYDTGTAISRLQPVIAAHTQVLALQNGIENYPRLVAAFGEERTIQGFCKIGASVPRPGVVKHSAFGEITIGEPDGKVSERTQAVRDIFEEAGVPVTITEDITKEVWLKFTWNCLLNMLTAAGGVTVERIFHHPEAEALCHRLFGEIQQIAAAEDVVLADREGNRIIESSKKLKGFETSTYQDRKKGKKMEYEAFTGAVVRLAEKHDLNVPHHQTLYALLKLIDRQG